MGYSAIDRTAPIQNPPSITNDAFFIEVDLNELVTNWRVPNSLEVDALETQLKSALYAVNDQLNAFKESMQGQGFNTLTEIAGGDDYKEQRLIDTYKGAVYMTAKAYLIRENGTAFRREVANNKNLDTEDAADRYLAASQNAIGRITNESAITIETI